MFNYWNLENEELLSFQYLSFLTVIFVYHHCMSVSLYHRTSSN